MSGQEKMKRKPTRGKIKDPNQRKKTAGTHVKKRPRKSNEKKQIKSEDRAAKEKNDLILNDDELKKTIASYNQAIKDYEMYYSEEMAYYPEDACPSPSPYYRFPVTEEYPYEDQTVNEYEQALFEYEANLKSIEEVIDDFNQTYQYIETLKGKEGEESIEAWKNYLNYYIKESRRLIASLENSIKID